VTGCEVKVGPPNDGSSIDEDLGKLSKEEIEKKLAEWNKWQSVSLDDGQDSKYSGTAVDGDGKKLNIELQQTENEISGTWKSED
jgi:hypothetical protein